jgi:hypothetical protein
MKLKHLLQVFVFFFGLSFLYGQNGAEAGNVLPRLDEAVKNLAGEINKKLGSEKAQRITIGQWLWNDTAPPLGAYWNNQLTEELTNISGRSFTVLTAEARGADWTVSGEILEAAGVVRVYTRIIRMGDRSVETGFHSDFEANPYLSEMLAGGSSDSRSPPVIRDAYEPDNRENPLAVEIGSSADGPVINRTLHHRGDEDFFLLSPGADGALIVETTGDIDTVMELYEAGQGSWIDSLISQDDDSGVDSNACIRHTVQAGRTYIAKVKGYGGGTGRYGFRAYLVESVHVDPDEFENDDESSAASEIAVGESQRHTFSWGYDVDWVKFQISRPGRYIIRTRGVNTNRLDTYIELYDQDFDFIDENDDGGDNLDSRLSVQLRRGTYYLKVECLDDDPDQPYTISIEAAEQPAE